MLAWLLIPAEITLMAAEVNVVLTPVLDSQPSAEQHPSGNDVSS